MTIGLARTERGFTLIEALVASGIFALVLVGAVTLFATNGGVYNTGQSKAEVQQNARIALESAAREIRMAGYDHSGVIDGLASPSSIQVAISGALTFVADVTGDDVVERVTYQRTGTQFVRDVATWNGTAFPAGTTGTIADGVSSLTFSYFDAFDAAIPAPVASGSLDNIERITVSLATTQTTVDRQATFPLVVDIHLRN